MKKPGYFFIALDTMLNSWGGDTPPEALWAFKEFVEWANQEYGLDIEPFGEQEFIDETFEDKYNEFKKVILELN